MQGLWRWQTLDAKLAWHSPSATCQIWLYGLMHDSSFKPIRPSLTIEVLASRTKFLEVFGYCSVVNYAFTFCTINIFDCFHGVMAQYKFVKHKFSNYIGHLSVQLSYMEWNKTMCQCTNYSGYLPWLELLRSRDICAALDHLNIFDINNFCEALFTYLLATDHWRNSNIWFDSCYIWFICLTEYQLLMGYLMPKQVQPIPTRVMAIKYTPQSSRNEASSPNPV